MELPHEIKIGVPIMRDPVERKLAELEIDPAHADPAVIFRHACEEAVDHWMITSEDHRLRCAIGVLLLIMIANERFDVQRTIEAELRALASLDAATRGVPVDFSQVMDEDDVPNWVGLVRIWQEVRRDAGA